MAAFFKGHPAMSMIEGLPPPPVKSLMPSVLSFVAGYVDGCTILGLFGLFVAQVTGSFVIAGAQLVAPDEGVLVKVLAIPVFFSAAVATTVMIALVRRHGRALVLSLAVECALLVGFLLTALSEAPFYNGNSPAALLASCFGLAAMGVQSALVRLLFPGVGSTNVMTTNTTQVAIDASETAMAWLATRRQPGDAAAAAHYRSARGRLFALVPLGLTFFAGTVAGTVGYMLLGFWCLTLATAIMLSLIGWAMRQG
jgi:uncharacterized membrane protein YoaK (UPF0700 family)